MTYAIEKLCKFDFETRSDLDLPKVGTYAYATHPSTDVIILTYAIGATSAKLVHKMGKALTWADLPADFRAAYDDPEFKFVAFNTPFDRAIWNYALIDAPYLPPERTLDAMAQAMASNLPASLDQASKALGGPAKLKDGGKLGIALFSQTGHRLPWRRTPISGVVDPADFPEEWEDFCRYAVRDTDTLSYIWSHTRALPEREWRVFWANEALCERGMGVDVEFCQKAAALAEEAGREAGKELARLTNGELWSVNQHIRLADWVFSRLPNEESQTIMITALIEPDEREEDDKELPRLPKLSINRRNVERLLDWFRKTKQTDETLKKVLELREFGASAAPKKYAAAIAQQSGGRLRGQITFMGAAQTGRFSGKGVQPQNLTRTPLGPPGDDYGIWEAPTVDLISDGCSLDQLNGHGDGEVALRKLALLVRPAIIAPPGRTLIKADYSQVEARGCPWLANSPDGEKLLQYFRDVDADPSLPDLYVVSASGMLKKTWQEVTKAERQTGKVASLACQFGGAVGALTSMAANYRMYFNDGEARTIVDQWRAANPWAPQFWGRHNNNESYGLIGAAMRAYNAPRSTHKAGRVAFNYEPGYLGGTLFMQLPSKRLLTYPWCKFREYEVKDKKTGKVIDVRKGLTFRRPDGMRAIYGGLLCIAEGTPVLTKRGWIPIESVQLDDRVWDGDAWVAHAGVIYKGTKDIIEIDGVRMTPDHLYLSKEGWKRAEERHRFDRAEVRLPDGVELCRNERRQQAALERPMRMQQGMDRGRHGSDPRFAGRQGLPLLCDEGQTHDAWHDEASGVLGLAIDARPLPIADASVVAQLRGPRHRGVFGVGELRTVLGGYGANLPARLGAGAGGQQSRVFESELHLGYATEPGAEPAHQHPDRYAVGQHDGSGSLAEERDRDNNLALSDQRRRTRVYDILDAGPRNRFVVAGSVPLIVHNCENATQATCADLLREALVVLNEGLLGSKLDVILHSHDEIVVECDDNPDTIKRTLEALEGAMTFDRAWAKGFPLAVDSVIRFYYSAAKLKDAA